MTQKRIIAEENGWELQQFEVIEKYVFPFDLLIANYLLVIKSMAPRVPSSLYHKIGIPGTIGVFVL